MITPVHCLRSLPATLVFVMIATTTVAGLPPPASAYIQKLAADPTNDSILFAATNGNGLYRSTDAGDHWQDISPSLDLRHYNIVVFDPRNHDRIFTGGRDSGLWVSTDNGESWSIVAFAGTSILSLAIDPRDSRVLYALLPDGVHRTTTGPDGDWARVFDYAEFVATQMTVPWPNPDWPVQFGRFQHLTLDPHDPNTLYVGGRWEGGYHRSPDGGDTWIHETIGPLFRRGDRIVVDPADPRILYAETHHQGMFKSYNRGRSWVSSSHGLAPQKRTPHYGAVLISGSAFDPADPTTLYAGSDYSNWKTTDAGLTWHELGETLTCEFARSFLVTRRAVYAGTNVGIYRSFDGGDTWETCNRGLPTREILATTTGTVGGERYEFAVVKGRPAVFRRSLDTASDWVSISWLLYENASDVRFETSTETLVIDTPHGERRSANAGLRWDVPPTVYAEKAFANPSPPPVQPGAISLAIHGVTRPDDSRVDSWYQRPPYVALSIVGSGYPQDGSEPKWKGHWDTRLSGTLDVPDSLWRETSGLRLRVEVRDFQYGTRIGEIRLRPDQPHTVHVEL